jgi:CRP-like cAMP-binding protein
MAESLEDYFMVWGTDQAAYGPVEMETLKQWVQERRVTAGSWVFAGKTGAWLRAKKIPELKAMLGSPGDTTWWSAPAKIDPQLLRRISILAGFSDTQLEIVARLVELERAAQGTMIVSQGQIGDSLYLILQGELRVCLRVSGKDATVTTLKTGDFFGDIALLDQGNRSADVVANEDCLLARLSGAALDAISERAVEVAAPLLQALDQALAERIRADNERLAGVLASVRQRQ